MLFLFMFLLGSQVCTINNSQSGQINISSTSNITLKNCTIVQNFVFNCNGNFTNALFEASGTNTIVFRNVTINNLVSSSQQILFNSPTLNLYFSNVQLTNLQAMNQNGQTTNKSLIKVQQFTGSFIYVQNSLNNLTDTNSKISYFTGQSISVNNLYMQIGGQNLPKYIQIVEQQTYASLDNVQLEFINQSSTNITFSWADYTHTSKLGILLSDIILLNNSSQYADQFCPTGVTSPKPTECNLINNITNYTYFYSNYEKFFINIISTSNLSQNKIYLRANNFNNVVQIQNTNNVASSSSNNIITQNFCFGIAQCICGNGASNSSYCKCGPQQLDYNGKCVNITTNSTDGNTCTGNRTQNCVSCGPNYDLVQYVHYQSVDLGNTPSNNITSIIKLYKEPYIYMKCVRKCGDSCLNANKPLLDDCTCQCKENIRIVDNQCTSSCIEGYQYSIEQQQCYIKCKNCIAGTGYVVESDIVYSNCSPSYKLGQVNTCTPKTSINQVAVIISAVIIIIAICAASGISIGYWVYTKKLRNDTLKY